MFMPERKQEWLPEPCAAYEARILDLQHGELAGPVRRDVEAHMNDCPACRHYAQELQSLDAVLTTEFQGKVLPASFKTSLLSRIDAAAVGAAPDAIARRKRAIESEFRRQSVGLFRRVLLENWSLFLDTVGLVTLAIVIALLAQRLASGALGFGASMPKSMPDQAGTYLLWATAVVSVAGAFWFGFRDKLRSLMQ